ncbi:MULTISPECIES: urea transporter [unclassified Arthrobacter]|uniref:urea transporter n=1 Tax=unclassified Arthrobacter TaxID=235627 RepID=UPI0021076B69|nr:MULTISPECIES: urea transporter [unclassified Arthrobacter]MCQ1946623.1 urea transporter [Arthrobacter sp. zg-Y1116]MCQ1995905.1 urea transporter [Arthrobacter sp. zg-Y1171]UWX83016.1 urea transporter [Arthrobacter sp. zg-Y1171]
MSSASAASPNPSISSAGWLKGWGQGLSQIFFQSNIYTALLILAAFVVADWRMAVLVLIGCAGNTVGGRLLKADSSSVTSGLEGFCGALVGAATFSTIGGQWAAYPIALIGGLLCAPVTWLVVALFTKTPLRVFSLPSTTAPFCIVATGILLSTEALHVTSAPSATIDSEPLAFARSLLTNVSEVVLINNVWSGALILLGLFVASWKVGLAGLLGSVVGSLCALAMGEALTETANGLAGYSGVLTAIALAVVFLRSSTLSWVLAVIGTVVTAVVTVIMHDLSAPTYTWPYILTTWVFLVIAHYIPAAKRP